MNYSELNQGAFFECKAKATYVEIYIYAEKQYIKVFSLQRANYNGIIGYGERKTIQANGLVPITLTEETIQFIFNKYYGIGMLDVNLQMKPQENGFTVNPNTAIPKPIEPEKSTIVEPILLIDDVPVVFVNQASLDCEIVPDDEVEVEDVEMVEPEIDTEDIPSDDIIEYKKKDYKWLWIAAATAALLV
jgi:hypothetical protein